MKINIHFSSYLARFFLERKSVCSLFAQYFHQWHVRLYRIFPHHLINGKIFEKKKVFEHKMCFDFLYNFLV